MKPGIKQIADNRKARHNYFVEETYEAGIALTGTEVKSIRQGKVNLKDSHIGFRQGDMYIYDMHISPYEFGNIFNREPLRIRRILMHRREIDKLYGSMKADGYTLIPLDLYFKNGFVKVTVGLCRGKKQFDKREDEAVREVNRTIDRVMKNRGE